MRSSVLACGALRAGLRDLPFLRLAQALLECREVEGLLQHDKALLHRIARAVAIARREQHRHPAIALANGMPELKPGHSARHQDVGEHDIDLRIVAEQLEGFVGVRDLLDHVTELLEIRRADLRDFRVVFHQRTVPARDGTVSGPVCGAKTAGNSRVRGR